MAFPIHGMIPSQSLTDSSRAEQHVRRYATEPPTNGSSGSGSYPFLYFGLGGAAVASGAWYYFYTKGGEGIPTGASNSRRQGHESEAEGSPASRTEEQNIPRQTDNPMMVFKGGDQGWLSLKLESVEPVNHNTKKLRFHLPEEDSVSGLAVACK